MYYELYIDVFFLVNFIMDILVLCVSKKILKCPVTYGRICCGALLGAGLTCVFVVIPITYNFVKFMVFHGIISILMTKTGLRIKWNRNFIKAYVVVYISAVLIGGVLGFLNQYVKEGIFFFVFAIISYFASLGIWNFISRIRNCQSIECDVLLKQGETFIKAKAIMDTGNRLRDTVTGKPVSIISKSAAAYLWKEIPEEGLRYISYHTIGKRDGILPMLQLDEMRLLMDEEKQFLKVLVAISDETIGEGDYDVILNPDI